MEERILAKGERTSIKKMVMFCFILSFVLFAFVAFYYVQDINGCQRHSVTTGEIHIAQSDIALPGQTYINKISFVDFIVSSLVFEIEITQSLFIPLMLYESILMLAWGILHFIKYKDTSLTITNKRIYGVSVFGKRVDIPLHSITSVSTSGKRDIRLFTPSGKVTFRNLKNSGEIYQITSKVIAEQQSPSSPSLSEQVLDDKEHLGSKYSEEATALDSVNLDKPKFNKDARLKTILQQAKTKAKIIIPIVVAAIILVVLVSSFAKTQQVKANYESAVALMENGKYTDAIDILTALGNYKDSPELIMTAIEGAIGFSLNDESYKDIYSFSYDAAQGIFVCNWYLDNYYSSQGFSKEDYIETYGSEEDYNKALSDFAAGAWKGLNFLFDEYEIDIPIQVCFYESSDSSTPVLSYG